MNSTEIIYFTNKDLIPNDGSKQILDIFGGEIDFTHTDIYIYPDVHYKKGARVVNGMVVCSEKYIYPACLGVDNCGFTFGKVISKKNISELQKSFERYSKILKSYTAFEQYSDKDIIDLFNKYLEKDFLANISLYQFLGVDTVKKAEKLCRKLLSGQIRRIARKTLCSLGGGNHFFEIHQILEVYKENDQFQSGDFIFILHSDSIGVGNLINLTYSNLSELDIIRGSAKYLKQKIKLRIWQLLYLLRNADFLVSSGEVLKLLYSQKDHRTIKARSSIGKHILFEHNLASLFGEMNRDAIIANWGRTEKIEYQIIGSHSHDSIRIENSNIIQRNGVQFIGEDPYFMLPSAMGNFSYVMENTFNEKAFYSANHGLGRIQDKHIAREQYNEVETYSSLEQDEIKLYRVGTGNIAEQNKNAFKDAATVIETMRNFNLGKVLAKTKPIAILKG
jgi:RNA-splicing ligase RtcB